MNITECSGPNQTGFKVSTSEERAETGRAPTLPIQPEVAGEVLQRGSEESMTGLWHHSKGFFIWHHLNWCKKCNGEIQVQIAHPSSHLVGFKKKKTTFF